MISDDPTFPPALPLDPLPQQDAPPFWENVPSPERWPEFWLQAGPWLAVCLAGIIVCIVLLVRQRDSIRRARAAAEREAAVIAARAERGLDRRSSRVRAVEEAEARIAVVPVADETLIP